MNFIYCLLIILTVFIICSFLCTDHFKPINSLSIKYNSKNALYPGKLENKYKTPSEKKELTIQEQINSRLSSQPLSFNDQIYSSSKYPGIGTSKLCNNNNDCNSINSICDNKTNICTLRIPDKTVFDIKY